MKDFYLSVNRCTWFNSPLNNLTSHISISYHEVGNKKWEMRYEKQGMGNEKLEMRNDG